MVFACSFFNLHFADVIQLLVEVVEKRPWDKIVSGQRQRWKDGIWVAINSDEVPQICKMEAQVWLALNNLLVDQTFRLKYKFTSSNKAIILRVLKTIYCVAHTRSYESTYPNCLLIRYPRSRIYGKLWIT